MSTVTTRALPDELIEAILLQLPALPDSKESLRTLCRFGEASSRFLAISRSSHIWQSHYLVRWKRCNPEREEIRRANAQGDWWQMFITRNQADCTALNLLDSIATCRGQRDIAANELASFGYDVWQAIFRQTRLDTHNMWDLDVPKQGLTVQYWAREVLGVISRVRAINIWKQGRNHPRDESFFEQGMAALSAFFGADLDAISEEFDRLAKKCQEYLGDIDISNFANQTEVIIKICAWMRQEGFVKSDLVNFHNLLNHFPHSVLFGQPRTLPLSLVYVFVCIARRLQIHAYPVAFPHKVLVVILPAVDQQGEAIYVDVFESASHPILSYSGDLPAMLLQMGVDPATLPRHTAPASTVTMVIRAAANIMQSLERQMGGYEGDIRAANYAACCAFLLLTGNHTLVPVMFANDIGGPLDRTVVLERVLRDSLPEIARQELNLRLNYVNVEELDDSTPRSVPRGKVLYFVGMVFRHKKYGYVGLIKGWDYRCKAGNEWIRMMKVDELPRGAEQPFYQSFTPEGRTRYVAEDNIEPINRPTPLDIRALLEGNGSLGRWFDGVCLNEGRFVLSPESRLLYPFDGAFAPGFSSTQTDDN